MKFLLLVVSLCVAFASGAVMSHRNVVHAANQVRPRFEVIYQEDIPNDHDLQSTVIHDRESGEEIICFDTNDGRVNTPLSCVVSGRKW